MSRNDEDRILHGLYYYRESIDEDFDITGDQILWLAAHSYLDAATWCKDGEPQTFDISVFPADVQLKLITSKLELPLRYLHHRRLIKLTRIDSATLRIAVTFAGADRAIRLHTRPGRVDLWYREHRDGFLGVATTVVVALLTALATVLVTNCAYTNRPDGARAPYELPAAQKP
jgi:hypothetical protein